MVPSYQACSICSNTQDLARLMMPYEDLKVESDERYSLRGFYSRTSGKVRNDCACPNVNGWREIAKQADLPVAL